MMNDIPEPTAQPTAVESPPAAVSAPSSDLATDEQNLTTEAATPPTDAADSANETPAKKRVAPHAIVAQFIAAWPQAFFSEPRAVKPLAIGILKQMLANRPAALDGLNSHAIRAGIKFYTSRLSYHYGVRHNAHRIDLAGEPAEAIDEAARTHAEAQIAAITAARAANRPAPVPVEDSSEEAAAAAPRRPRRAPKRAATEGVATDEAAQPVTDREAAATAKPRRKTHPRPARAGDTRPPRAESPPTAAPADEGLSMAEKLARLAQHFGKPG